VHYPDLLGRVQWKTDTGASVYDGAPLGIGSGFNSLRGEITALKTSDPAAIYGTLGYEYNLPGTKPAGRIHLGSSFQASLGTTIALNQELAFSLGLSNSWTQDSSVNGTLINGSSLNVASYNFGLSYEIYEQRRLNMNMAIGITRDAPDYIIEASMPFQF